MALLVFRFTSLNCTGSWVFWTFYCTIYALLNQLVFIPLGIFRSSWPKYILPITTKMHNNWSYISNHVGNRNLRVKLQIPMSVKPKRSKIDIGHIHNYSVSADFRSRFIILITAEYLHDLPHKLRLVNNYSPKAKWILSNNPRDEVEGIIRQYSLSLRRIIVLV